MAHVNLRVRSDDGGRFSTSDPDAEERLAFGLHALASRGNCNTIKVHPLLRTPQIEASEAFDDACAAFLEAAGTYHAFLVAEKKATQFRCELVQDLEKKDATPKVRSCGKAHTSADQALRCAKRQYGKPGLVRIATAAAYQGDTLLLMDVTSERDSSRGRTVSCSGVWRRVPLIDGKPDMAAFEKLTQAGLGQILLESLRGRP